MGRPRRIARILEYPGEPFGMRAIEQVPGILLAESLLKDGVGKDFALVVLDKSHGFGPANVMSVIVKHKQVITMR